MFDYDKVAAMACEGHVVTLSAFSYALVLCALSYAELDELWEFGEATQDEVQELVAKALTEVMDVDEGATVDFAEVREENFQNGGDSVAGWQVRVLNTLIPAEGLEWISLSDNVITLQAGTYIIDASVPAFRVGQHQLQLRTANLYQVLATGTAEFTHTDYGVQTRARVLAALTFTQEIELVLYHYTANVKATNGLGVNAGTSFANVFSDVGVWRVGA